MKNNFIANVSGAFWNIGEFTFEGGSSNWEFVFGASFSNGTQPEVTFGTVNIGSEGARADVRFGGTASALCKGTVGDLSLIHIWVNSPVRAFRGVGGEPFFARSARGARVETCDGRELVDFGCAWGPALFGHNHPTIRAAIESALAGGTSFGMPCEAELEMARMICGMIPVSYTHLLPDHPSK